MGNLSVPLIYLFSPSPCLKHTDKEYDDVLGGPVKAVPPGKFYLW